MIDTRTSDPTRRDSLRPSDRALTLALAIPTIAVAPFTSWENQLIWWLAWTVAAAVVTDDNARGAYGRLFAHVLAGATILALAAGTATIFGPGGNPASVDTLLKLVAVGMTIGAARDACETVWRGRDAKS